MIGSAASAVQCIPEIARMAAHLTVLQRTPNWVLPKNDQPYRAEKLEYFKYAPDAVEQNRARLWSEFEGFLMLTDADRYQKAVEAGLGNIALLDNSETRSRLTPAYSFGCKRVLLSSKYYQAFNRANVALVIDDIARVTLRGVVTNDGAEHVLATLVYATGFKVTLSILGRCRGPRRPTPGGRLE